MMMLLEEKIKRKEVVECYEIVFQKVLSKVLGNNKYKEKIQLFLKNIDDDVFDKKIEEFIRDIIFCELDILQGNDNYYIDKYIKIIRMGKAVQQLIKESEKIKKDKNIRKNSDEEIALLASIKKEMYNVISVIKQDADFKERFIGDINEEKLNEVKGFKECKSYNKNIYSELKEINKVISEIFNYEEDIDRDLRIKIIKNIDIEICPYCNISEVSTMEDLSVTDADYEHMLPKGTFPLFSVSYGNFIPACKVCNGSARKGVKVHEILNPRIEGFSSYATFDLKFKRESLIETYYQNCDEIYDDDNKKIEIFIDNINTDSTQSFKIKNAIEMFGLMGRYNTNPAKRKIIQYIKRLKSEGNELYLKSMENISSENISLYVFKKLVLNYSPQDLEDSTVVPDYVNIEHSKIRKDVADKYFKGTNNSIV